MTPIPLIDLAADYRQAQHEIDETVGRVLAGGWYILGKETAAFEAEFAAYCGLAHAVGVGNGTDAILMALRALDIGPGDEVITVAHTAVATVAAIELAGARPILVDVDPTTATLNPALVEAALTERTRAIMPVHLYGNPADLVSLLEIIDQSKIQNPKSKIHLIEDCAQAHGAHYRGRPVGSWGDVATFSFYPTKNLGAIGDGGAVVTNEAGIAERLRLLRQYGWRERYISDIPGHNTRLDELQAAILRIKLRYLEGWNETRRRLAAVYRELLADTPLTLPIEQNGSRHVYHLYVVQTAERDALQAHLTSQGIGTGIHYPVPVHLQPAYVRLGYAAGSLPVTEQLAKEILSLPMHPHLSEGELEAISQAIHRFYQLA
jgi:dTDP-3-amino-3,4,6-trideoxy-alpha-D-glucose transaminase